MNPPAANYQEVSAQLAAARNQPALIAAAQRIQHVPDTSDQLRLGRIVKRRLDEFKGK